MFWLIKQVFIVLLSFGEFLASKCVSLNNKSCMARPSFIGLNPVEFNYYSFIISLDKYSGNCNAVDYLFTSKCVPSKIKVVNIKVLNMITKLNEAKTLVKHISCNCKCKFDSTTCNSNQKRNSDKSQCERKKYCTCKKYYN